MNTEFGNGNLNWSSVGLLNIALDLYGLIENRTLRPRLSKHKNKIIKTQNNKTLCFQLFFFCQNSTKHLSNYSIRACVSLKLQQISFKPVLIADDLSVTEKCCRSPYLTLCDETETEILRDLRDGQI